MRSRIVNGSIFYLLWFYCMWAAVKGVTWQAELAVLTYLAVHIVASRLPLKELFLILIISAAGVLIDTAYIQLGVMTFASPNTFFPQLAPLWIVSLYAVYAASMNYSLNWLRGRYFIGAILGAVGGSFSYLGGVRMGAAIPLLEGHKTFIIVGIVWALFLPISYVLDDLLIDWKGRDKV